VKGQMTVEQAKVEMRRLTRIFVRRQSNWFKESDPDIHWFHPENKNILSEIETLIRNFVKNQVL